ncbi:MAG: MerR family transcriptional regulator [Planctomycetes bacterium]|nr:MerR family transcriptional regulator [Planctomycetota bacterium]
MEERYTIGELAARAQVPVSTVRYYERRGLLRPRGRSLGNYRLFGEPELERLRFIKAAQATGLTLEDAAALLDLRAGKLAPCPEVQDLLEARLSEVEGRLKDLRRLRAVIRSALEMCKDAAPSGRCAVLGTLEEASKASPASPPPTRGSRTGKKDA